MSYFLIAGSASFSARPNRRHVPIVGDDREFRSEAVLLVEVQMFFGDADLTTNPERGRPIRSSLKQGSSWHSMAVGERGLSFSVDGYDRFSVAKIDCYGAELDFPAEETCVLLGDPEVVDFVVSSGGALRGSILAAIERAWNQHRSQPRFRRAFDTETDSFRSVRLEQERRFLESLNALEARDANRGLQLDAIRARQRDELVSAVGIPTRYLMKEPCFFSYLKTKKFVKLVLALKRVGQAEQRARDRVLNWRASEDEDAVDRRFRLLEVK